MYIRDEQPNTLIDLDERVQSFYNEKNNDIIVEFDCSKFTQNSFNIIQQLSEILANDTELNGIEPEEFELDVFEITINNLQTYEEELIKCER